MDEKTEWAAKDEYGCNYNVERLTFIIRKPGQMKPRRKYAAKNPSNCEGCKHSHSGLECS